MSLHEPVPQIKLAPDVSDPFGADLLLSPIKFTTWLLWWPQALYDYEQRWIEQYRQEWLSATDGPIQSGSKPSYTRRQNKLHLLAAGVAAIAALTFGLIFLLTMIVVPVAGPELPPLLALSSTALFFSALSGTSTGLLVYLLTKRLVVSLLVAGIYSAITVDLYILWRTLLIGEQQPTWPQVVVVTLITGFIMGVWLSIYLAYERAKDQQYFTLASSAALVVFSIFLALGLVVSMRAENDAKPSDVAILMAAGVLGGTLGFLLGILRVDDALLAIGRHWLTWPRPRRGSASAIQPIAHITPLRIPHMIGALDGWLESDWKGGMRNVCQVWAQTRQQHALSSLMEKKLAQTQTPGRLVERVGAITGSDIFCGWSLLFRKIPSITSSHRPVSPPALPLEPPYLATAAGFFYLEHGYAAAAEDAFKRLPDGQEGKRELMELAAALRQLREIDDLTAAPTLPVRPRPDTVRRKLTWEALDEMGDVRRLAWLFRQCKNPDAQKWCFRRAIERSTEVNNRYVLGVVPSRMPGGISEKVTPMPRPEGSFIKEVLIDWRQNLYRWEEQPPERTPIKRIPSPFHFTRPITMASAGFGPVDRQAEVNELSLAWQQGNLQTVVVYGQPLIGKSSLVLNPLRADAGRVTIVPFSLAHVKPHSARHRQFVMALCHAVGEAVEIPAPPAELTEWDRDHHHVCIEYLQRVSKTIAPNLLVIFVDDFDHLRHFFASRGDLETCLHFLAQVRQSVERTGFVLAMRHIAPWLDEPKAGALIGASRRIYVDFLGNHSKDEPGKLKPVFQLLNDRLRPFGLRFQDEAVEYIYRMTNGHPYLINLIAHCVVSTFDARLVTEPIDPLFMVSDVNRELESRDFELLFGQFGEELLRYVDALFGDGEPDFPSGSHNRFSLPTPPLSFQSYAAAARALLKVMASREFWTEQELTDAYKSETGAADAATAVPYMWKELEKAGVVTSLPAEGGKSNGRIAIELFRCWLCHPPRVLCP